MRAHPRRFSEWESFSEADPNEAAREVINRIANLPAAMRRAIMAWQPSAEALAAALGVRTGPFHGIPFMVKDLFDVAGAPTYAGSTFLPEVRPASGRDAAIVKALRETGMGCAGKTHMNEFAFGNTGENPHYGDCPHPLFPDRLAGGSSSGSAAAVAAGLVPFAVGSDTAGSIRGPAAFCGLYGFRLIPGHAWIRDGMPLAPSFDTPGWFTNNAKDMLTANSALVQPRESTREPRGCYLEFGALEPDVAAACRSGADRYCAPADPAAASELRLAFAGSGEAYSVLSSVEAATVHADWIDSHRARFSQPVWDRVDQGRRRTREEIETAQTTRISVRSTFASYFLTYEFLVMPAVPLPALTKAQCTLENRARMLELCAPASLAGLPALTVPVPLPNGLTAGLQIIAPGVDSPVFTWALRNAE